VANDSCNVDHFSTKGRTIWLQGQLNDFFLNEVTWNAFELDSANIHTYRLYRDYGAGMQLIETISGGSVEYTQEDMVDHLYAQSGEFCYRVEADYTLRNHEGITENYTTRSNTVCLEQRPSIYIPNAIVPGSQNGEFKPLIVFGNPTDYSLQIFSRWGAKIFESNNPDVGWFGTNGSDLVPTGGYAYVISFRASDGTPIEKKGIVSVIR
ncbi:MAG: gliding motility-associated C-terminal domain-containing protein, partial [Chitinophagales bacterium]